MKRSAPLREYSRKRHFEATPEPAPEPGPSRPGPQLVPPARRAGHRFCVQEHYARRRHYDLRLEMDGVLKSWAVPKGPTLDPEVRRLAMATEDHPLEYLTFEGHIPEGNYGAGEVIVWDLGDYEPLGATPPLQQWEKGHLKFQLYGKKLAGEFALIHVAAPARDRSADGRARPAAEERNNAWLLIKKRDEASRYGDVAEHHPGSAIQSTKKTSVGGGASVANATGPRLLPAPGVRSARSGRGAGLVSIPPMLATLADKPFRSPDWLFEIKWDGIRARAEVRAGAVRLLSRSGRDLTAQYPELAQFPRPLDAVLDGEIVALDDAGKSSFHRLQQRMNVAGPNDVARARQRVPVDFYTFDLLELDGGDLTHLPLIERKQRLAALPWLPPWRYSDHVVGDGPALFEAARQRGLEGIVAKRADSRYEPGRSRQWLKFKLQQRQEAAIVGYTDPQGSRTSFGALLIATYDDQRRQFDYVGRVGSGFDARTRAGILARLKPSSRPTLAEPPAGLANVHWVAPELVAEVKFAEWTPAGLMRAPVFLGLRPDKAPPECIREAPAA